MENKNNEHYGNRRRGENASRNEKRLTEARKVLKARKRRNGIVGFAVTVPIVIISAWLLFDKLFIIRNFEIRGSKEYTTEQAQLSAENIGIHKGDHIFGFDKKTAELDAKYRLPAFDSVKVSFEMPDTVVLNVVEAIPSMYTLLGNKGYVLSESLRVISMSDDTSECEGMGLIRLELENITKCVAGEFLVTGDGNDEIVKMLYAVLEEEGIAADVTGINVTDKFDITFDFKKQFEVKLGDDKNLTVKIRYMKAILNELKSDDSGVIDVSDDEYRDATFKPYNKM